MNDNINPYAHYRPSDYIEHYERIDAKGAVKFAETLGYPLNVHVECVLPEIEDPIVRLDYGRLISHKIRCFYRIHKLECPECLFLSVRHSDPEQGNIESINYMIHVPDRLYDLFRKIVLGWSDKISVQPANSNTFNYVFGAISPETKLLEPDAPERKSGRLVGPRYFSVRVLWKAARIKHRNQMLRFQTQPLVLTESEEDQ